MPKDRLVADVLHEVGYIVSQCLSGTTASILRDGLDFSAMAAKTGTWKNLGGRGEKDTIAHRKSNVVYRICHEEGADVDIEVDGKVIDTLSAGECIDVEGKVIKICARGEGHGNAASGTYERVD